MITCAGKSFNNDVVFQGSGGWSLVDDFTCTRVLIFQSGSFQTMGKNISCSNFISTSGLNRYLDIENSTINLVYLYNNVYYCPWEVNGDNLTLKSQKSNLIYANHTYETFRHYNEAKAYNNRNMNWTGALYEPIIAGNNTQTLRIYGSLTCIASMTNSFQGKVYFESIEQGNMITCAGKSFNNDVVFQGSGGWSLVDDFTCTRVLILQSGSFQS